MSARPHSHTMLLNVRMKYYEKDFNERMNEVPAKYFSLSVCVHVCGRAPYAAANFFTLLKHHAQVQKQQFQIPTET